MRRIAEPEHGRVQNACLGRCPPRDLKRLSGICDEWKMQTVLLDCTDRNQDQILLLQIVLDIRNAKICVTPRYGVECHSRPQFVFADCAVISVNKPTTTSAISLVLTCASTSTHRISFLRLLLSAERKAASHSGSQNSPPRRLGIDSPRVGIATTTGPVAALS